MIGVSACGLEAMSGAELCGDDVYVFTFWQWMHGVCGARSSIMILQRRLCLSIVRVGRVMTLSISWAVCSMIFPFICMTLSAVMVVLLVQSGALMILQNFNRVAISMKFWFKMFEQSNHAVISSLIQDLMQQWFLCQWFQQERRPRISLHFFVMLKEVELQLRVVETFASIWLQLMLKLSQFEIKPMLAVELILHWFPCDPLGNRQFANELLTLPSGNKFHGLIFAMPGIPKLFILKSGWNHSGRGCYVLSAEMDNTVYFPISTT